MQKNISQVNNRETCCGCGACASICSQGAIKMDQANNGFLYPVVDKTLCVNCGLCVKVCDFKSFHPTGNCPVSYAARQKDVEELMTSRSGGFFMAVCNHVINICGGLVFGCEMDGMTAVHKYETTYEGCKKFKGSKYVQSIIGNTYSQCADFLKEGRTVLFSGTGCQVGGLLKFLETKRIPTSNLITIDIICHGVPSPGVWNNYVKALEEKENTRILKVDFRNKSVNGWADHIETYLTNDGRELQSRAWTTVFYRHVLFRESCYNCSYTTVERKTDFTIADYWGINRNAPQFDDDKGCSLVLVHSDTGKTIFEEIKKYINYEETNLDTSMQPQMKKPIWRGWDYNFFWRKYNRNPEKAMHFYFFPSRGLHIFWNIESAGKKYMKKLLKLRRKQ